MAWMAGQQTLALKSLTLTLTYPTPNPNPNPLHTGGTKGEHLHTPISVHRVHTMYPSTHITWLIDASTLWYILLSNKRDEATIPVK
jgi:hypothetical protein